MATVLVESQTWAGSYFAARGDTATVTVVDGDLTTRVEVHEHEHPQDSGRRGLLITATAGFDVDEATYHQFEQWAAGDHPGQHQPEPQQDAPPPPPDPFVVHCDQLGSRVHHAGRYVFEVLRWRSAAAGPDRSYVRLSNRFSVNNGGTWHDLPHEYQVVVQIGAGMRLTDDMATAAQHLINSEASEPLGHQLLREAQSLATSNPRAALVIGVAAAEVGFKHLVGDLVPDARWLIETVPSPPLPKMLKDYLPTLPTRLTFDGAVHPPPKHARTVIHTAVKQRNAVAHQGDTDIGGQDLVDTLLVLRDTLYLFDYYAGHDWAIHRVNDDYLDNLGT